ncbi:MAG: hypothetical protein ACTIMJ_03725 [Weissella hellenica]|uniref:hypothetical protein n=1 Tax=Weissella hellenica TaxID=46256 RepID=UPI003F9CE348
MKQEINLKQWSLIQKGFIGMIIMDRVEKGNSEVNEKQRRRINKLVSMNNRLFWKNMKAIGGTTKIIRKPRWRRIKTLKHQEVVD